jgi:hypothetical protein
LTCLWKTISMNSTKVRLEKPKLNIDIGEHIENR